MVFFRNVLMTSHKCGASLYFFLRTTGLLESSWNSHKTKWQGCLHLRTNSSLNRFASELFFLFGVWFGNDQLIQIRHVLSNGQAVNFKNVLSYTILILPRSYLWNWFMDRIMFEYSLFIPANNPGFSVKWNCHSL